MFIYALDIAPLVYYKHDEAASQKWQFSDYSWHWSHLVHCCLNAGF